MSKPIKIPSGSIESNRRQKIVVGINSLVSTTQPAYSNHIQLFYRLGRSYPKIDFCLVNPPRMSIDRMRNLAAETALEIGATHLLFIDDDVLIPSPFDFLHKLLAHKAPVAAGDVIIRGWPFMHMAFRYTKDKMGLNPIKTFKAPYGPEQVDAVGFSCCLIECSLIKQLPKPYFITGVSNTEDIYFCMAARDKFPDCKIVCDTTIQCGHILSAEIIEPANLLNYRKYWKAQFKPGAETEEAFRGKNYYNLMRRTLDAIEEK